jgi:phosphoglycerol transferase MdoB-like AlkP superfamily enzyme
MTDRSAGEGAHETQRGQLGRLRWLAIGEIDRQTAWRICAVLAAAHLIYYWLHEGWYPTMVFTIGVSAALASFVTLLSRRALFAATLVTALAVVVVASSSVKRRTMDMVVHAYDLFFYFSSWSTIAFLWSEFRGYLVALIVALLATLAAGVVAYRIDGTRVRRSTSALAFTIAVAVAWGGAAFKGQRPHTLFYWEALYVSSFYSSWAETIETLWRGQLVEAAPSAPGAAFALPSSCAPEGKPPHIILIHQESVVQPSLFPGLKYDHRLDGFFRSFDGRTHRLRVETYGGASWLTEFSILAGVSTHSFGGMRPFVQSVMQGKLRDTLPEALLRCGYRNVVFYPMLRNFVSNARFYASIGLNEIFDLRDQGASSVQERDRFYYNNALNEMARHFESSAKPLFTYIQTMSAHAPFDFRFAPEMQVPGGGPGTHPDMHEYLRRLWLSQLDYDELKSELKRRFPNERFLIMHYGDHHPTATRILLGIDQSLEVENIQMARNSLGYVTYYTVDGINYRPPPLPPFRTLDVPYLGSLLLQSAGLPLSDSHRERLRLMQSCGGLYDGCRSKDDILRFHRRLIDSGLMAAR